MAILFIRRYTEKCLKNRINFQIRYYRVNMKNQRFRILLPLLLNPREFALSLWVFLSSTNLIYRLTRAIPFQMLQTWSSSAGWP